MKSLSLKSLWTNPVIFEEICVPTSEQEVCLFNCNDYVKVSKTNDISVNSTVHDDCPLKRNKVLEL